MMKTYQPMTDEAAMTAVRKGDLDKAAILYERYKRVMFNFFLYLRYDRDQSLDFTQQVFYRMLRYRETYQDSYEFRTWIYRIARNVHNDNFQKNIFIINDLQHVEEVPDTNDWEEENEINVRRALNMLPDDYRQVLVLSRYENMKYEQIAEVLGCTIPTVKVRVFRAIQKLREVYFQLSEQ